ncbi:MAG: S8 family serine peptidase [Anaerolineaceae bacterium]
MDKSKTGFRLFSLIIVIGVLFGLVVPVNAVPMTKANGPENLVAVSPDEVTEMVLYPDGVDKAVKEATGPTRFILTLDDSSVASYDGHIAGYDATSPLVTGALKLDVKSPDSQAYLGYLADKQSETIQNIKAVINRDFKVVAQYSVAINGLAVELEPDELLRVAAEVPGILKVEREKIQHLDTDVGPTFVGAADVWTDPSAGTKGEGVLVGIIDGGINFDHPSFADIGPVDSYNHTNPLGSGIYVGVCDPTNIAQYDSDYVCNDKLIGAYSYVDTDPLYEKYTPEDSGGHGSHTASTVAGNVVLASMVKPTITETQTISGVAPHANIIAYDVCVEDGGDGACYGAAILSAINQAIIDQVDVINFSISGGEDPYNDSAEQAFLNAFNAGIFVSTSAGNNGPGPETTGHRSPWLMSTAASTHNRAYPNGLVGMTGGDTTPPVDLVGKGFTSGLASSPIVYAGDFGNRLCYMASEGGEWTAGTDFTGKIVVCDRGDNARVDKARAVLEVHAAGFVLANNAASADALVGDAYVIPGVHISYDDGVLLKAWLATGTGHMATILGATRNTDASNANIMADFSSRGPNGTIDILKPDVTAPGVDIWAAVNSPEPGVGVPEFDFYSGTSMSSPHTAGTAALLTALHPTWTPAEIKSALMLTAINPGIVKEDSITDGDVFDFGSGLIQVNLAAKTGLVMNETKTNFDAANPASGGNPQDLNLASVYSSLCLSSCSWSRIVKNPLAVATSWTSSVVEPVGVTITVSPATFSLAAGATQVITITANVDDAVIGEWAFGDIKFTEDAALAPDTHIPLAVNPSSGILPDKVNINTRRDAGSQLVAGLQAVEITDLTIETFGLTQATLEQFSLLQDPTNGLPYDDWDDVWVSYFVVPESAQRFVAEITATTSNDLDMYLLVDDGVNFYELTNSATAAALEYIDVMDPPAGEYYVITQNWDDSVNGQPDDITLAAGVVDGDEGNMWFTGPSSVAKGDLFDLRLFWDDIDITAGDRWYGVFTLGSDGSHPGNIGTIPVDLKRFDDDVSKTADVETAVTGDIVTYTITVEPNVTGEDLTYYIEDTIPAGMTFVPGSLTGGAILSGNKITWSGVMSGKPYYSITTDATDPMCDTGFGGYADLKTMIGANPIASVSGDTKAWTTFSGLDPFVFFGNEYKGVSFTDDGFLVFDYANNYAGSPWIPQLMPNPDMPNNVAAMLWQDMEIVYQAGTRGVSLASDGVSFGVIEYDDIQVYGDPTQTYDFEAVLSSGVITTPGYYELVFAYDNIVGDLGPVTIGVENALGSEAYTLVNQADASTLIQDGTMVCFDYVPPSTPHVITYQLRVTSTANTLITNTVKDTVYQPGAKDVFVSNDLWINHFVYLFPLIFK